MIVIRLCHKLVIMTEHEACWHLLKGSEGLDSLVIGAGQIFSQVKGVINYHPRRPDFAGNILGRLLITSGSAYKRVRSKTGIAKGAVSISPAEVELAEMRPLPDLQLLLENCRDFIVGAHKMSGLLVPTFFVPWCL